MLATGLGTPALVRPLGIRLAADRREGLRSRCGHRPGGRPGAVPVRGQNRAERDGRPHPRGWLFRDRGDLGPAPDRRRALQLLTDTARYVRDFPTRSAARTTRGSRACGRRLPTACPYLGEHPRAPGVIVAAGHGMLGITLGSPPRQPPWPNSPPGPRPAWLGTLPPGQVNNWCQAPIFSSQAGVGGCRHRIAGGAVGLTSSG